VYWDRTAKSIFKALSSIAFLLLVIISVFTIIWTSIWIADARPYFIQQFWGFPLFLTFWTTIAVNSLVLIALITSAAMSKSIRLRPSLFLHYTLIVWVGISTITFFEARPWKWDDRIATAQQALLAYVTGDLSREFVLETNCSVQSENHCWRQIELFVDTRFCKYATALFALFPVNLVLAFVILIAV
jgi:hypothetical protein